MRHASTWIPDLETDASSPSDLKATDSRDIRQDFFQMAESLLIATDVANGLDEMEEASRAAFVRAVKPRIAPFFHGVPLAVYFGLSRERAGGGIAILLL